MNIKVLKHASSFKQVLNQGDMHVARETVKKAYPGLRPVMVTEQDVHVDQQLQGYMIRVFRGFQRFDLFQVVA